MNITLKSTDPRDIYRAPAEQEALAKLRSGQFDTCLSQNAIWHILNDLRREREAKEKVSVDYARVAE